MHPGCFAEGMIKGVVALSTAFLNVTGTWDVLTQGEREVLNNFVLFPFDYGRDEHWCCLQKGKHKKRGSKQFSHSFFCMCVVHKLFMHIRAVSVRISFFIAGSAIVGQTERLSVAAKFCHRLRNQSSTEAVVCAAAPPRVAPI